MLSTFFCEAVLIPIFCHRTSQVFYMEDILIPPSVVTDGCAPYHRFKSFPAPFVLYIHSHLWGGGGGGGGGGGVRDQCQIRTGGVS